MTVRINPSRILLWRSPTELQLGVEDPLVLQDVTAEQERLLALLERGMADDSVAPEDQNLIARLGPALLAQSSVTKPQLSGEFVRGAFAELIRASYITNRDGIAVLEQRAKVGIHIDSLGKGGLLLALGLAAAGIGRIYTSDDSKVGEHDLGPLGYPTDYLNQNRVAALVELLRLRPGSTIVQLFEGLTPAKRRHSLRVITGQNALMPSTYRTLVEQKVPHIAVLFGSDWVSISPRILGKPCLGCLERHRTEAEPLWSALASQLVGRADYLEDARSALFAASIAIGEIIRAVDTPTVEAEFVGQRLRVSTGLVERWSWQAHPDCECA